VKLTFLGTGTSQGIPVITCSCPVCHSSDGRDQRLRTSALIEHNGTTILIDAGPDFRQQMLNANVKNMDAILLTHEHRDHIAGLDDIRAFNYFLNRPMDIWAENRVQKAIKNGYDYAFCEDKYPGSPEMILHNIDGSDFFINSLKVIPIRAYHYKMPVYGFRIEGLTYITDANRIEDDEKEKIIGSKCLVLNALRKKKHMSHFSLDEACELISELKPNQAFITHISHQMGLHVDVEKDLPKNVYLAYDRLTVEV
jgi:phosphoribosyl 1,2-cyclic phosphate phosphodiesterase